ncbi:hypothetical protein H7X46_10670 [Pseudonocardia sp. C8]|uniref:hypothetical protein n=1 Tax=Pseudonocardia sp. C8 TaxID=2762759 RepID=UPI001642CCAF|nr:hypothetical protein [Pseudonocardia sp. C8]MBC3191525.1 hypothetical protein [Pseudonocardia sp. C8]
MTEPNDYPEDDPRHHTTRLRGLLDQLADHALADVDKVSDPGAQALFETTAEVCRGLAAAMRRHEQRT